MDKYMYLEADTQKIEISGYDWDVDLIVVCPVCGYKNYAYGMLEGDITCLKCLLELNFNVVLIVKEK